MIAAAIFAILFYPSERATGTVAIAALLVTTGKTAYDIFDKERERQESADDRREKLLVKPRYGMWDSTGIELGVLIYNASPSAVHVSCARCYYRQDNETKKLDLLDMKRLPAQVIASKHTARFRCGASKEDILNELAKLAPKDLWITVETHEGQSVTVDGDSVLAVLNSKPASQFGL
jgi:hypothetical protein